jgi:hypothetical protein
MTRSTVRLVIPPNKKRFRFLLKLANFNTPGITVEFEEFPISGKLIPLSTDILIRKLDENVGALKSF